MEAEVEDGVEKEVENEVQEEAAASSQQVYQVQSRRLRSLPRCPTRCQLRRENHISRVV